MYIAAYGTVVQRLSYSMGRQAEVLDPLYVPVEDGVFPRAANREPVSYELFVVELSSL